MGSKIISLLSCAALLFPLFPQNEGTQSAITIDLSGEDAFMGALKREVENAYEVNLEGLEYLDEGDLETARQYFKRARDMLPVYSDAQNNYALTYYREGDTEKAEHIWKNLLREDSEYARAWYNLGLIYVDKENYHQAYDYFSRAAEKKEDFAEAYYQQALCAREMGTANYGDLITRAYRSDSGNYNIFQEYVYYTLQNQDTLHAVSLLEDRPDMWSQRLLGEVHIRRNQNREARDILQPLLSPENADILAPLIDALLNRGEYEEVLQLYGEYTPHISPDLFSEISNNVFFAYYRLGKKREALRFAENISRQQRADSPLLVLNVSRLYYEKKEYEASLRMLSVLNQKHRNGEYWYIRALNHYESGGYAQAEESIQEAFFHDSHAKYYVLYGLILQEKEEFQRAKGQFRKALSLDSENLDAAFELALLDDSFETDVVNRLTALIAAGKAHREDSVKAVFFLTRSGEVQRAEELAQKLQPETYTELRILLSAYLENSGTQAFVDSLKSFSPFLYLPYEDMIDLIRYLHDLRFFSTARYYGEEVRRVQYAGTWELLYLLGYSYYQLGSIHTSHQYLQRAYEKKRDDEYLNFILAHVLSKLNASQQAEDIWQNSLRHSDHEQQWAYGNLMFLSSRNADTAAVKEYSDNIVETGADADELFIEMARLYADLTEPALSIQIIRDFVDDGAEVEGLLSRIYWEAAQKERDDIRSAALDAADIHNLPFYSERGEYYLSRGSHARGIEYIARLDHRDARSVSLNISAYLHEDSVDAAIEFLQDNTQHLTRGEYDELRSRIFEYYIDRNEYQNALDFTREEEIYNRAFALFSLKRYSEALFTIRSHLPSVSREKELRLIRLAGDCAIELEDWEGVLAFYSHAFDLSNSAVDAYNSAVAAYHLGDYNASHHYYSTARSRDEELHNEELEKWYSSILTDSTQVTFEKLQALADVLPLDTLFNNAVRMHRRGDTTQAEEIYARIIERDQGFYRAWNNLGVIAGLRGEVDRAIEYYKNALQEGNSSLVEGYINLVELLISIEEYEAAEKWAERGLKQHPSHMILRGIQMNLERKHDSSR
jgi:tetratricopeptide (TPR) repeat protein